MYSSFSMQCTLLSPFHVLFFLYAMYSLTLCNVLNSFSMIRLEIINSYSLNITIDSNVSGDSLYFKILLSWLWPLNPIKVGGSESMHNVERRAPWKKVLLPESNCLEVQNKFIATLFKASSVKKRDHLPFGEGTIGMAKNGCKTFLK